VPLAPPIGACGPQAPNASARRLGCVCPRPRRQQEVADKVFDALRAARRWPIVYIDDMQKVLDRYEPI